MPALDEPWEQLPFSITGKEDRQSKYGFSFGRYFHVLYTAQHRELCPIIASM